MFVALAVVLLAVQSVSGVEVEGCVEGFVMDLFCINRGTLLDNPSVTTLEEPNRHSVHCLVDIARCYTSGFEILLPNPLGSPKYGRALRLDDAGNQMVINLARSVGMPGGCSTCKGTAEGGKLKEGFRATFFGKVSNASSGPDMLAVRTVVASPRLFQSNAADGCGNATRLNITLITESGGNQKASLAHGSLMIISWGFLLPTGIASAHFLKHRPNALWFKLHRVMQIMGLIIAIAGWSVALATFDVFTSVDNSYKHGALGMTVMVLGILQPINAFFRPHPAEKGETKPLKRLLWEIFHKSSGYIACILATVTIIYGTIVIFDHNTKFRAAWGCTIAWVVLFCLASAWDRHRAANVNLGPSKDGAVNYQGEL